MTGPPAEAPLPQGQPPRFFSAAGDDREYYLITDAPGAAEWRVVATNGRGESRTVSPEPAGMMLNQHGARLQPGQTGWMYHWSERVEVFLPRESDPIHVVAPPPPL